MTAAPSINVHLLTPSTAKVGDKVRLEVTKTFAATRRTVHVTSPITGWTVESEDAMTTVVAATVPEGVEGETDMAVQMERTWDGQLSNIVHVKVEVLAPVGGSFAGHQPGKVYLGVSTGGTMADAVATIGPGIGEHRTYYQWDTWDQMAKTADGDHAAGRIPWLSIKTPGWAAVASGKYDADIAALNKKLDVLSGPVLVCPHHEPTNDVPGLGSGADWAAMYCRVHDRLTADNVTVTPIIGDWSFNPQNTVAETKYNRFLLPSVLERTSLLGIDLYMNGSYNKATGTFAARMEAIIAMCGDLGYEGMFGTGETGADDSRYGEDAAVKWLHDAWAWCSKSTDRFGVMSYFHSLKNSKPGADWELEGKTLTEFKRMLASDTACTL